MIGNDDGVHTGVDRMYRIVRMQNPLQNDRNTRVLPQKADVFPSERRSREQSPPQLNRRHGILLRRLLQQPAKNRGAEILRQTLPQTEWQIAVMKVALAPAQRMGVQRYYQRRISRALRTLHHAGRQLRIFPPIQLEP